MYQKNHFLNSKFQIFLFVTISFHLSLIAETAIISFHSRSNIGKFAFNQPSIKLFQRYSNEVNIIGKLILALTASTILHFRKTILSQVFISVAIIFNLIFASSIFISQKIFSSTL